MSEEIHHKMGKMEGRIDGLENQLKSLEHKIDGKLNEILSKLESLYADRNAVRGGWKVLTVIVSSIVAVGGFIVWVIQSLS